jgi:hypothetical protein
VEGLGKKIVNWVAYNSALDEEFIRNAANVRTL